MEGFLASGQSSLASGKYIRLWTCMWCVLAVLHVTQSIWTSLGRAYPGDLADGRFNQLVLEHGYQALRGESSWASPAQFYPVKGTLAYSDTHVGTLPIYAAARFLRISREEAWQVWFVVVAALNVWAAFRLFRQLGVHPWLRGPLTFASAGSAILVWVACTHVQMLPLFPALFGCEQLLRWRDDRQQWRGVAAAGWLCWQFAASPYAAFFSVVVGGLAALAYFAVGRNTAKLQPASPAPGTSPHWLAATTILLVGAGLAAAAIAVFAPAIRAGYSRSVWEIQTQAPRWTSWLRAPPVQAIRGPIPATPGEINLTEHCWFDGWIVTLLLPIIVVAGWRQRHSQAGRLALALALVAIVTPLLFTSWTADGDGAWVWLASRVELLRAFRASGRIAVPLQFAAIGGCALGLTRWIDSHRSRWVLLGAVAIAGAIAAENFCSWQRLTLSSTARARTQALIDEWKAAGDRPVLVYAPARADETPLGHFIVFSHLDAWSAALQLRRATVNGYSGNIPASHVAFRVLPTPENARETLRTIGLPESEISFVDRPIVWSEFRSGPEKK